MPRAKKGSCGWKTLLDSKSENGFVQAQILTVALPRNTRRNIKRTYSCGSFVVMDRVRARFKPSHFSRSVAIPNVLRFVLSADRALGLAPSNAAIVESTDMELKREVG
jgi:NAD(P)H-flavin reductase